MRDNFGSRLGVILATAGSAVGLGNVWRFPYMAGENGGAAFMGVYIVCVLLLGLPCMVSEFIIGRHAGANTMRAYGEIGGRGWRLVGMLGVLTAFLITGYYAVVSGWCLEYIWASLTGRLLGTPEYVQQYFADFSTDAWRPVVWTVLFFAATHLVITRGVQRGIERASKLLMPTLFVLLVALVVASCMLPGAGRGIAFLFQPDFSKVTKDVFLGALGQSFYSMSIAMGCLCTFASYFSRETDLGRSAMQIALIDSAVAILAGLMIFPAAFSAGVRPDSGPALVFITLPNVFTQVFSSMPLLAWVMPLLFYALLSLAALTSLISLHEVSTAFFSEELHITRHRAALLVSVCCCVIGVFCSLSLGAVEGLSVMGMPLFDLFDFVTGQVFLPIGGFLTCVFLGWFAPHSVVRGEFMQGGTLSGRYFHAYLLLVKYVCPTAIAAIFLHQLGII
jgi:NSS family neurotransmitter:Na+ symporter